MSNKINTNQISDITTFVDDKDTAKLLEANGYTDTKSTETLNTANTYTDDKKIILDNDIITGDNYVRSDLTNDITNLNTQLSNDILAAILSSNNYTDSEILSLNSSIMSYVDSQDLSILDSAKLYSDTQNATYLATANQNAQEWDNIVLQASKDYTDSITGGVSAGYIKYSDAYSNAIIYGYDIATTVGTLDGIIQEGVSYTNSIRNHTLQTPHTFTASSDIYIDIQESGALVYNIVSNGGVEPILNGTDFRLGKVITNASEITSFVKGFVIEFYESDTDVIAAVQPELDLKESIINVDTKDTNTLNSANTYTDGEITSLNTSLTTYIDTGDTNALNSANTYTDTSITNNNLNYYTSTEVDAETASATSNANIYTDTQLLSYYNINEIDSLLLNIDLTSITTNIIPDTDLSKDIGSATNRFVSIYSNNLYSENVYTNGLSSNSNTNLVVNNNLYTNDNDVKYLGGPSNRWLYVFAKDVRCDTITSATSTGVKSNYYRPYSGDNMFWYGSVLPTDLTYTSGSDTKRWTQVWGETGYFNNIGTSGNTNINFINNILTQDISPSTNGDRFLGKVGARYGAGYIDDLLINTDTKFDGLSGCDFTVNGLSAFGGTLYPSVDDLYDLGHASFRWQDIYASNAVIQTSDRNLKKDIKKLDDNLVKAIFERLSPVEFKMIDGSRTHYGFIAQDIEDIHTELGIDIAWLIKSQKTEIEIITTTETEIYYEDVEVTKTENIELENGEIEVRTYTDTESKEFSREVEVETEIDTIIPGEYIYGLRYEEFVSLQTRYTQLLKNRLDSIESRLLLLENI